MDNINSGYDPINISYAPITYNNNDYVCDPGDYISMANTNTNITNIMQNFDNTINETTNLLEKDEKNKFFKIKRELIKYLKNDIEDINILLGEDKKKEESKDNKEKEEEDKEDKGEEKIGEILIKEFDNFLKYFDLKQKELIKIEKKFIKEIQNNKKDIKQINDLIDYLNSLKDRYNVDENNKIVENMYIFAKNISENSKIDEIKEEYIERKKEMVQYLDILKYLNKGNVGNTCSLCLTNNVDIYFDPCGHTCCEECLNIMENADNELICGFCRKNIYRTSKIYYL